MPGYPCRKATASFHCREELAVVHKRLHKALKENSKHALRSVKIIKRDEGKGIEDEIIFSILASESAICANSDQIRGGMSAAELSMEEDQTSES
jgi:hypothetical protein